MSAASAFSCSPVLPEVSPVDRRRRFGVTVLPSFVDQEDLVALHPVGLIVEDILKSQRERRGFVDIIVRISAQ